MSFELPEVHVNAPYTWGPPTGEMTLDGQPFQLYFKSDAVAAFDWYKAEKDLQTELAGDVDPDEVRSRLSSKTIVVADETRLKMFENERRKMRKYPVHRFNMTRMASQRAGGGGGAVGGAGGSAGGGGGAAGKAGALGARGRKKQLPMRGRNKQQNLQVNGLPNTIALTSDQVIYNEVSQAELNKATVTLMPTVADVSVRGQPPLYNANLEKVSPVTPIVLDESAKRLGTASEDRPSAIDDPTLVALAQAADDSHPHIFTTDEVLSLLMTCGRSFNPWHVRVLRHKRNVFLYKDALDNNVDKQWVSETDFQGTRPSEDDTRVSERISSLGEESTRVHEAFVRACCTNTRAQMRVDGASPFPKLRPRLYRYRRFTMHPGTPERYDLVVRCDVDAVTGESRDLVRLFGLLDHTVASKDGSAAGGGGGAGKARKAMDTSSAAVMLKAYDANACKIARWIALSMLSDVRYMKIGFVARAALASRLGDASTHEVRSVHSNNPRSLATQLGVNVAKMWGAVDALLQPVLQQKYVDAVMVKPSDAMCIRIAEPPAEDDSDDDDDDDDDDDNDEDGDDDSDASASS